MTQHKKGPKKAPIWKRKAKLGRFKRLTSASQLKEGMILIDKHGCQRRVLQLTKEDIWMSHKFNNKSHVTGKTHKIENFLRRFPNWIYSE